MSLADHVRTLGRGPGRSRSLTEAEARDAMQIMLAGNAAPEAIGALLMLLRMKGETAQEIAGFAAAAQAFGDPGRCADLDWPVYAAGRTRGLPWFLLSARLVAAAGHKVLLHGWRGADTPFGSDLDAAGIPVVTTPADIAATITRAGIAYAPLETFHPRLFALLSLREVLGLRSCINTVCRMLNPASAPASVQGVFHPSYRLLQADASILLGWRALTVIKGGGGEFERHPSKPVAGFGCRSGALFEHSYPALRDETCRLAEGSSAPSLAALWSGGSDDGFARDTVLGTAALALETLGHEDGFALATRLWDARDLGQAA